MKILKIFVFTRLFSSLVFLLIALWPWSGKLTMQNIHGDRSWYEKVSLAAGQRSREEQRGHVDERFSQLILETFSVRLRNCWLNLATPAHR